tara:strand:+ start:301 stop:822 length:522 start_codon:yes stop_codon:yes gene_type:complete
LVIIRYLIEVSISLIFKKYLNPFSAIAHFALGLLLVSISFNSLLSTERALNIKINEFEEYKDLTIYFKDIRVRKGSNFDAVKAEFNIKDKNGNSFDLSPEKRRYFTRGQITTETAIHVSPLKDIYLTIGDQLEDGSWIVNVQINFLIRWIWFSACLMAFAGIVLVSTNRKSNI